MISSKCMGALVGVVLTGFGAAACGSASTGGATSPSTGVGQHSTASTPAPAHSVAAAVPVLKPSHSATFKTAQQDGPTVIMTWTMGGNVVRVPDNSLGKHGFEDVAFDLTVKDVSTTALTGDPTLTTWLMARSPDGRTDETLQSTAATNISQGTHGLTGSDLSLESGVQPGAYVSGYVEWPVPDSTATVFVLNPNTSQPELQIDLGAA